MGEFEGRKKGEARGKAEGKAEEKVAIILKAYPLGLPLHQIAELVSWEVNDVQRILEDKGLI
jgi:predicted transposase YdaD